MKTVRIDILNPMQIEVPDRISQGLEKRDLMIDLAVGMYAARRLTLGQAAELVGVSQGEFQRELGKREIPVHYDLEDLAADLKAAGEIAGR